MVWKIYSNSDGNANAGYQVQDSIQVSWESGACVSPGLIQSNLFWRDILGVISFLISS